MKLRTYILSLIIVTALFSCETEQVSSPETTGYAYLYARMAGMEQVQSRATIENGTYTAFAGGDAIGLYTDNGDPESDDPGSLRNKDGERTRVQNTPFTLGFNGKWQEDDTPKLVWETSPPDPADIYGYFPYKDGEFSTGGYGIFKDESLDTRKLIDVLVAERTQVENNNPAIFLTFKHRFALLKMKLGTGTEGLSLSDVTVEMNKGTESTAIIGKGTVDLQVVEAENGNNEFKPVAIDNNTCYIIVPVEKIPETTGDSLSVAAITIGEHSSAPFNDPFVTRINTIYNVTVHRGDQGSITITPGGIEEWGSDRYLTNIRETGGLYWPNDIIKLTNTLKGLGREPTDADKKALASWGSWDEDKDCFVFPVMRNIDMTEVANRNCTIDKFYGIIEGNGYYINGLDITGSGFIGTMMGGSQVNNLELKSITVNNDDSGEGTGALVGKAKNGAIIHNCAVTGVSAVKGGDNTGGMVGSGSPEMNRCSSNAEVSGGNNTGGLIGLLETPGSITQSYATGKVIASGNNAGGLAGSASGEITNSHAGCDVTGKDNIGGLVGSTTAPITGCTATGDIKGEDIVGGLAGTTTSTVNKSGSNGTVTGTGIAGGLIGKHNVSITGGVEVEEVAEITESYARATVTGGTGTVGGLIGSATTYEPEVQKVDAVEEKWIYADENNTRTYESTVQFDLNQTKKQWIYCDGSGIELRTSDVEIAPNKTIPPTDPETQWTYFDEDGSELFKTDTEIDYDRTKTQWICCNEGGEELYASDVKFTDFQHYPPISAVDYKAPKGTQIINCYVTNGEIFASNSDKGISYSYQIGNSMDTDDDNAVYTIELPLPTDQDLDDIITKLNAGSSGNLWVKGLVMIDGKSYMLPVLN